LITTWWWLFDRVLVTKLPVCWECGPKALLAAGPGEDNGAHLWVVRVIQGQQGVIVQLHTERLPRHSEVLKVDLRRRFMGGG